MRQTWRWFGPKDPIPLPWIRQAGVEAIVTALHDHPPGAVWPREAIAARKAHLAAHAGGALAWEVVESLPVSEAIKTQGPDCAAHLAAYAESLENLAAEGLEVVCYNFMPVIDWTRTRHAAPQPDGATAMAFDLVDFAVFDIHVLARPGAQEDHGPEIAAAAAERFAGMDRAAAEALQAAITAGLPGANQANTPAELRARLAAYDGIGPDRLRRHLADFLAHVVPVAERLGIRLCCHPDDPPFPLMGLPRVVSTEADYAALVAAVESPANGITFCTGSMGVRADFDAPGFVERLGRHVHFAHLRNTRRHGPAGGGRTSFHESPHLDGDTDMVAVVRALLAEQDRRRAEGRADALIPMRPDHGQALGDDLSRTSLPGYPYAGRLRGLAELRGVMAALGG